MEETVNIKGKKSKLYSARFSDYVIAFICLLVIILCVLPMINLLARSFSSTGALQRGEVTLLPHVGEQDTQKYVYEFAGVNFTTDAYAAIFGSPSYVRSMIWTALLTVMCTLLSMFLTVSCAYPLVYDKLKGRQFLNALFLFTMYFGAGLIPTYIVLNELKLINHPLVLMLPFSLSVFNMLIMRSFLFGIPDSLRESAEIDGAGPIRILISIYLPLSTSVLATLSLFYAVGRWNGFSDVLQFMPNNKPYYPIQYLLYNIINNQTSADYSETTVGATSDMFKAATVMFATVPILMVYPWLQRYFIKGVTIGAVKG